ncbi:MAG: hypothetical protein RI907_2806 [Pseudomonadota bacterium]|jgi:type I restriction enzyme S subunit
MELKTKHWQVALPTLPDGWQANTLEELSEFITSGSRGWARYYTDQGATFIRSQNVRNGRLDFSDHQCVTPPLGAEGSRTRVAIGDLLVTITGNSVGNVAYVNQELGDAYISQHVGLIRLRDPSRIDYICRYLAPGAPGNAQILACQSGQSKPGLNLRNLGDFWIALPHDSEIAAISTALSDIEKLIEGLAREITKRQSIKLATMQKLLSGETRLPNFKNKWNTKTLGDHLKFIKNGVNSRAELSEVGDVKYLHYGDIHGMRSPSLNISDCNLPRLPATKAAGLDRLQDGDLVFADASEDLNGVGKAVEVFGVGKTEVVSGLHTIAVRFDKQVLADRFKGYLPFCPPFRNHLKRLASGTKVYATNKGHIATVEMRLPEIDEQIAIAQVLSDMDMDIATVEARLTKTRIIKLGMMQELLTGQTRLI